VLCKTDFQISPGGSISSESSLLVETRQQPKYPLLYIIITQHLMQYSLFYNKHHLLICSTAHNLYCVGFYVLTAVGMRSPIFWDIAPCSPLKVNRRFRGICRLLLQGRGLNQTGFLICDYMALYPRQDSINSSIFHWDHIINKSRASFFLPE
jgi:hypothetical protein